MSYFRKSGRGMGAFALPSAAYATPASAPAPTIEMAEDFVGNVNNLPICPKTDPNGWCRRYVGGPAIKSAINYSPVTTSAPKPTTITQTAAATTNAVSSVVGGILSALTSPAKLPGAPTVVTQAASGGMSTTTKVALAGGAVLLVALIARR